MKNFKIFKPILCSLLIFSMTVTLFSCSLNASQETEKVTDTDIPNHIKYDKVKDYSIIEVDGGYRLVFDDPSIYESEGAPGYLQGIEFNSLAELRSDLLDGQLTFKDKFFMYYSDRKDENGIIIPDLNNLYSPVLPNGNIQMKSSGFIFRGDYSAYCLEMPAYQYELIDFFCLTVEGYNRMLAQAKAEFPNDSKWISEPDDLLKDNEVILHEDGTIAFRRYIISNGNKTMFSMEKHDDFETDTPVYNAEVFYISDGRYFKITFMDLEDPLDPEWLFEFDVESYVPEGSA